MAPVSKSKPAEKSEAQKAPSQFATFDSFLTEVRRLLIEKRLRPEWVDELIDGDQSYLEGAFERNLEPVYAAFEIYITEEESAREPVAEDCRLKLDVNAQARTYLQELVGLGLWGDSVEGVAATLIQQQLASKLEAGLFKQLAKR